jgi:hypothetical protein
LAYNATIIPVMIASPGDVSEEREAVREVIHDWNDVNASSQGVVLTPVGWETHSSPELGARPQELINERLLNECDLLIAVYWTRLGSPTGESSSGTVEEIEEHIGAGKPAMLYFSSKPVAPESIDAEQYAAVQDFKKRIKDRGLINEFENLNQFRTKLAKQLQLCLLHNGHIKSILEEASEETIEHPPAAPPLKKSDHVSLSEESKHLLKFAASEKDGAILKTATFDGRHIQVGRQTFGGHGKEAAKWEEALNDLVNQGLVVPRGYKGQVFELTHKGWRVAEEL